MKAKFNDDILKLQNNLKSYAMSLTSRSEDAEDLFQETYLKALSNREKYRANTNLRAWMYTIMKNTFINSYRKQKSSNTIIDSTDNKYYINQTDRVGLNTTENLINEKEINKQIDHLDEDFKKPFRMFTNGFKYKEIAEKMDIPIGTVKSRIFFSRKKLSESLQDFA